MKIKIPFRDDMMIMILAGGKHCTSRNKKYGEVGDTFNISIGIYEYEYELTRIEKFNLGFVATFLHDLEGFSDAREFIDIWNEIHPVKGFNPNNEVWVHWFRFSKIVK